MLIFPVFFISWFITLKKRKYESTNLHYVCYCAKTFYSSMIRSVLLKVDLREHVSILLRYLSCLVWLENKSITKIRTTNNKQQHNTTCPWLFLLSIFYIFFFTFFFFLNQVFILRILTYIYLFEFFFSLFLHTFRFFFLCDLLHSHASKL